jgi:hypothetical protein
MYFFYVALRQYSAVVSDKFCTYARMAMLICFCLVPVSLGVECFVDLPGRSPILLVSCFEMDQLDLRIGFVRDIVWPV